MIVLHVPGIGGQGQVRAPYLSRGKRPRAAKPMVNDTDYDIVARYGAEYRGIVQYYLLAGDVFRLHRLRWVMETSMLKTLARKHRSSVTKMAARHKAKIETPHGPRTRFRPESKRAGSKPLVARFGGIPLRRQRTAVPLDRRPDRSTRTAQLVPRLLAERCEICTTRENIDVHHVRKLADLDRPGRPSSPHGCTSWRNDAARPWSSAATATSRSTRDGPPLTDALITGEPDARKRVRPVREEADGKGPEPRAPRRRPTSLGGRPSGKGPAPR